MFSRLVGISGLECPEDPCRGSLGASSRKHWKFQDSGAHAAESYGGEVGDVSTHAGQKSGKKKERNPKLFGPGIFGWGVGLPREGGGVPKKIGMSFETQGIQTFWRDIPGLLPGYPGYWLLQLLAIFLGPRFGP